MAFVVDGVVRWGVVRPRLSAVASDSKCSLAIPKAGSLLLNLTSRVPRAFVWEPMLIGCMCRSLWTSIVCAHLDVLLSPHLSLLEWGESDPYWVYTPRSWKFPILLRLWLMPYWGLTPKYLLMQLFWLAQGYVSTLFCLKDFFGRPFLSQFLSFFVLICSWL